MRIGGGVSLFSPAGVAKSHDFNVAAVQAIAGKAVECGGGGGGVGLRCRVARAGMERAADEGPPPCAAEASSGVAVEYFENALR